MGYALPRPDRMPSSDRRIPTGAIRIALPDATQQKDYSCGASCLQSICKFYGVGPDEEWEYVDALGMDHRIGSHPFQIVRLARRLGLTVREYQPMTTAQLRGELQRRHPVMLMIQAWADPVGRGSRARLPSYAKDWKDGHWVAAIGQDRDGFFFEDPSLEQIRGYLSESELDERWRDTGPHGKRMPRYGAAIWHPRRRVSAYETRAARIE